MFINLKSPLLWVFVSGIVIFLIGTACASVAKWFMLVSSSGWLIMGVSAMVWWFSGYIKYKNKIKDLRFQDAYIYAEENEDPEAVKTFGYDKKTERQIGWQNFNKLLTPLCGILFVIIGVIMFITAIQNL